MAKNRQAQADPHESSSSSDDEAHSEENIHQEDSETESESEPEQHFAVKPSAPKKLETPPTQMETESESDDSGSDSDIPPRRPDRSLKSTNSEAKEVPEKFSKKPRSKPAAPVSPPPAKPSATTKRSVESDPNGDRASKKPKKNDAEVGGGVDATPKKDGEDSKKQLFQRLFSEEDEIALLEGLIDYKAKNGIDPLADMSSFHDFIKNSIHVDVSKAQLTEKVRRCKKKFENNIAKAKDGKERKFSNPHEQKAFELSKKVWSVEANGAGVDNVKAGEAKSKKNQKAKLDNIASPIQSKEVTKMGVALDAGVSLPLSFGGSKSAEELILDDGLEIVDGAKKLELEREWKQLKAEEVKLYLKRVRLIEKQAELVLQAIEGSGH